MKGVYIIDVQNGSAAAAARLKEGDFIQSIDGVQVGSSSEFSETNVARDFVELPSQFNEHWALDSKVFKHYAVHYKTGQPTPRPW